MHALDKARTLLNRAAIMKAQAQDLSAKFAELEHALAMTIRELESEETARRRDSAAA